MGMRMRTPLEVEQHFWSQVQKSDGCWLWTGAVQKSGHGRFFADGKTYRAHRWSFEHTYGPVESWVVICHNCPGGDNPTCIRPEHLFAGTQKINLMDMREKQRHVFGSKNKSAIITEDTVREILRRYATENISQNALAISMGLGASHIGRIVTRKGWRHVAIDFQLPNTGVRNGMVRRDRSAKLSWDDVREIRELYAKGGVSYRKVAIRYGLTKCTVYRIVQNLTWKEA